MCLWITQAASLLYRLTNACYCSSWLAQAATVTHFHSFVVQRFKINRIFHSFRHQYHRFSGCPAGHREVVWSFLCPCTDRRGPWWRWGRWSAPGRGRAPAHEPQPKTDHYLEGRRKMHQECIFNGKCCIKVGQKGLCARSNRPQGKWIVAYRKKPSVYVSVHLLHYFHLPRNFDNFDWL